MCIYTDLCGLYKIVKIMHKKVKIQIYLIRQTNKIAKYYFIFKILIMKYKFSYKHK